MSLEIYTKKDCPTCEKARELLDNYQADYREFVLGEDFTAEYIQDLFPGVRNYPILAMNDKYVGGYGNLAEVLTNPNIGKDLILE